MRLGGRGIVGVSGGEGGCSRRSGLGGVMQERDLGGGIVFFFFLFLFRREPVSVVQEPGDRLLRDPVGLAWNWKDTHCGLMMQTAVLFARRDAGGTFCLC